MMQYITQMKNFCKGLFTKTTPDRTKLSIEQTKIMCNMWAAWKKAPSTHVNQYAFTKAVNDVLGINKSKTTIIRHVKANLNEIIQ